MGPFFCLSKWLQSHPSPHLVFIQVVWFCIKGRGLENGGTQMLSWAKVSTFIPPPTFYKNFQTYKNVERILYGKHAYYLDSITNILLYLLFTPFLNIPLSIFPPPPPALDAFQSKFQRLLTPSPILQHAYWTSICFEFLFFVFWDKNVYTKICSNLKHIIWWVLTNADTCVTKYLSRHRLLPIPRKFPFLPSQQIPPSRPTEIHNLMLPHHLAR